MVWSPVAIVLAGDLPAADGASGPLSVALGVAARATGVSPVRVPVPVVRAWDTVDIGDEIMLVPTPVPNKNDKVVARGAAASESGRSRKLVRATVKGRSSGLCAGVQTGAGRLYIVNDIHPPGSVIVMEFDTFFRPR